MLLTFKSRRFALPALLIVAVSSVTGQVNTGRISGFVYDPAGASVPGVTMRATNEQTGIVTTVASQETGDYLINFLIPGTYRLEGEKEGFQKSVHTGLQVSAGGISRIDVNLRVGETKQQVEVIANALAVATETSELSQSFGNQELDRLPNIDRNPLYQMNLMPGANNGRGSGGYGNLGGENPTALGNTRAQLASLGGVNANANSVFVEGTFNREPQNATVSVLPSIEGIEEVQIYTGKYNAEFGFSGSAVVNVITKSGSNEYHGAMFEYLRNQATDAKGFFAESKTPFRRNQFGGAFGGPIKKNKLFFFGNYQGTYFRTSGASFITAPTPKMIQGDFSELYDAGADAGGNANGQLYDPFSRVFKEGQVVSATPFAGNIIPKSRWDAVGVKMNDMNIWGVANRPGVDDNLYALLKQGQTAHSADGRIDYNHSDRSRGFFRYSILRAYNDNSSDVNQFWQAGEANSSTINQNMQVTHFFSFNSTMMNELRLGANLAPRITTDTNSMDQDYNNQLGLKNGNLGDPATRGLVEMNVDALHTVGDPDWVAYIRGTVLQVNDAFTLVKNRHNVKFGGTAMHVRNTSADTLGGTSPRGTMNFNASITSFDGEARPYGYPSVLLGTPTWSARARFVAGAPYQTYWQNAFFVQDDWKLLPSLTLNMGLRYEMYTLPVERFNRQANFNGQALLLARDGDRSPGIDPDRNGWSPRVGLAWSPDRGKTSVRGGYGRSFWQAYWQGPLSILGLTYPYYAQTAFVSDSLVPGIIMARDGIPIGSADYDAQGNLIFQEGAVIRGVAKDWRNQVVDQLSVNVQREIVKDLIFDVGYLRVKGGNNLRVQNINMAPPGPPGQSIDANRPLHTTFPELTDVPISYSKTDTWYDAVTAQARGRVGRYLNFLASYAHGRTFDNARNLKQFDYDQYRGPSEQDIAHIFNGQLNAEVPVGRGRMFGGSMHPVLDAIVGGWEYSGFVFLRSGTRFGVAGNTSLNNGQTNRPDRIGDGNLPVDQRTLAHWYDTAAFVRHPDWATYGNAGTNPLFADGMAQLDSSIFKTFNITERVRTVFRWDLFNTFNHPDFNPPTARVGSGSNGRVTSTSVAPRGMQFGLRLYF
ncbi:MAG: TonB-dependent receptor [Bryobacteraceae bacterium]|nr:TonB-dependent receptor [Bryobacteraceae bacterium]